MRERIARLLALALGVALVLLAALFAERRNAAAPADAARGSDTASPGVAPVDSALVANGRAAFDELGCARCHALEGRGNPRSPLDGVGARRDPEEIRAFIVAEGEAAGALRESVVRAKERYREVPEDVIRALVAYLQAAGGG